MSTLDSLEAEYKPKISVTGERFSTFGCAENSTSPVWGQDIIGVKSANQDEVSVELHSENIGTACSPVTSFPSKKKKAYKTRPNGESAHRRLRGFLLKRLKNPEVVWAKVDFKGFKELTKFCATQVYRAKRRLKKEEEDIVFRAVTKESRADEKFWRLAHFLKNQLKYKHWNNCKVKHSLAHAFNDILWHFAWGGLCAAHAPRGCNRYLSIAYDNRATKTSNIS